MNTREQMLRKHNERLAAQVRFLLDMMDNMAADHELLGSVACGFAWDMTSGWNAGDEEGIYVWEASARRAEAFLNLDEQARGIERFPDGTIKFIDPEKYAGRK